MSRSGSPRATHKQTVRYICEDGSRQVSCDGGGVGAGGVAGVRADNLQPRLDGRQACARAARCAVHQALPAVRTRAEGVPGSAGLRQAPPAGFRRPSELRRRQLNPTIFYEL